MKIVGQTYLKTKWPAILWSVFVFLLLAMPFPFLPNEKKIHLSHLDKVVHICLFAILVFLWGFYIKGIQKEQISFKKILGIVVLLSVCYGIAMEYVQLFTGRDFDVFDMLADAVGAIAGALVVIYKSKPR